MLLAELNQIDQVTRIHRVSDEYMLQDWGENDELTEEQKAVAFMRLILGEDVKLVETREPNDVERFRERMAEIGGYYNYEGEYFTHVKPYPSWEWSDEYHVWLAPVEHPNREAALAANVTIEELEYAQEELANYWWDEDQLNWIELGDE